jgi:tRNA-splicing ligase RtcB (3'-phosphate/5'-hydroxy nucleic acid ligase)
MSKLKIEGKELRAMGYPQGPVISIAMNVMAKNYKHSSKEDAFAILQNILAAPADYLQDDVLGAIAQPLMPKPPTESQEISLTY